MFESDFPKTPDRVSFSFKLFFAGESIGVFTSLWRSIGFCGPKVAMTADGSAAAAISINVPRSCKSIMERAHTLLKLKDVMQGELQNLSQTYRHQSHETVDSSSGIVPASHNLWHRTSFTQSLASYQLHKRMEYPSFRDPNRSTRNTVAFAIVIVFVINNCT